MDNTDPSADAPRPDSWGLGQAIDLRAPEVSDEEEDAARPTTMSVSERLLARLGVLGSRYTRRYSRAVLDGHPLTFWSIEYCWVASGRADQNDLKDGCLRPVGAPFTYGPPSMGIVLAGRGAEKTLRVWRDGTARGKHPHDLIVPADVWTPRIYQEAVRRFYMRLFDQRGLLGRARAMPTIEFENAWYLPEEPHERALTEERARKEDAWVEGVGLSRRGRRRFERFGRDPRRPLG
ncbi:MAG: hypothetical protein M3R46_06860 [Actinomycetota bacterium]|nr:hypothetical protein [Actinomycetota bacterium]